MKNAQSKNSLYRIALFSRMVHAKFAVANLISILNASMINKVIKIISLVINHTPT
jgi:hypothetical protein